jgi:hypothetical protein
MTRSKCCLAACLTAAGIVLAGCGGSSHPTGGGGSGHTTGVTSSGPPPVTHADPVDLLPTASEVTSLIRPASRPTRYDEHLNVSTLSSAFSSAVPRSQRLASGAAELDVMGSSGTFLYVHVFEFKSLAGAESLADTFVGSTRLGHSQGRPSGAPGEQGEASSKPYGRGQVSYRYAFRDGNVLAYVELDGPQARYSLSSAIHLARIAHRRIQAAQG